MQILLQTIPPISRKLSSSLVKRSCERTCASVAPAIPKIPKNHANPASDSPPNLSSNTRDLSYNAHTGTHEFPAPPPSRKSPKFMQIQLQPIRPNARDLSYNTRTSTHLFPPHQHLSPSPSVSGKAASQAPPLVLIRPHSRRTNQEPNKIRLWLSCKTQQKTRKCVTSPILMRDKRRLEQ